MSILKSIDLELFKLRHRYFYFTWFILFAPIVAYLIYDFKSFSLSSNFIYQNFDSYYYTELLIAFMLLGLLMPICAGVLISKLMDEEHQADNWKLLLTSNSSFYELWYSKFLIVYFLMESTTLVIYLTVIIGVHALTNYLIPVKELILSFSAISSVNVIILTIAEYFATYFKNQLIVLTVSLIGGFLGIIAPLMSPDIVRFIPWGYYTLSSLCITKIAGTTETGRNIFEIINVNPPYTLIFTVSFLFLILNFCLAYYKTHREI